MNERTDPELLRDYAERRSEAAFAELVRRHIDLVHSAALRMVRDTHLAEDVSQGVFAALARDARQLLGRPVLSGWLHRTARNLAANVVRTEVRRRAREQEAATMNELLADPAEPGWEQIAPLLDEALGELTDPDRDALLLRYFERKSVRDMARLLGVSDEAAQKRVTRAVDRLREFFAQRGVKLGASGLVVVISANAVHAAPVGLAATVSTVAVLAGTTFVTAATTTAAQTIAMTTLQKALVAATVTVLAGAGIYQATEASRLRREITAVRSEQAPLAEEVALLQRGREAAARQMALFRDEKERSGHNSAQKTQALAGADQLPPQPPAPPENAEPAVIGRVVLAGTPPPETRLDLTRDPELAKQYPAGLMTRRYQVGANGGLQNVLVFVRGDFKGRSFDPPKISPLLDHASGYFEPYVMGIQTGQPLILRYPRNVYVQADSKLRNGFMYVWKDSHVFTEPEVGIRMKCECHLWNFAYVGVFDHPFFAVTDQDGNYQIRGVPTGRHTLDAWHPKAGTISAEVLVTDAGGKVEDIVVKPK